MVLNSVTDVHTPKNELEMLDIVRTFRNREFTEDDKNESLTFSSSLTSKERAQVHEMCEKLGLGHKSSGIGDERQLKVWQLPLDERLSLLEEALKEEEAAVRAEWESAVSEGSDEEMESAGFLLRAASLSSIELTTFGRAKWTISEDRNRPGQIRIFNVRVGSPVVLASKDRKTGAWSAAVGAKPGFVVGCRAGTLVAVFEDDEDGAGPDSGDSVSLLACPDSVTFDRMLLGLRWCRRLDVESPARHVLNALLAVAPSASADSSARDSGLRSSGGSSEEGGLNEEQALAVDMCCGRLGMEPVALVHGPFGTGKTKTLVEVIRCVALVEHVMEAMCGGGHEVEEAMRWRRP